MKSVRLRPIHSGMAVAALCLGFSLPTHAAANDHHAVYDMRGQPVLLESNGSCVRTKWMDNYDICQPQQARRVISQAERTVYFAFNAAALSPEANVRLESLAQTINSRSDVKGARVVGFADRVGTPSYNEALSKKRAENVKNYLVSKGIVNASVAETRWFGASMPKTDCSNNLQRTELIACLQQDRRVEVEIDYLPEVVAGK